MDYPRGSEWRKWDLHIHSKFSSETRAKLEVRDIFEKAIEHDISVISITDHTNVEALDEIWYLWENETCNYGKQKGCKYKDLITFFPGIELKASSGNRGVHFTAIFPQYIKNEETSEMQKVNKKFLEGEFLAKIDCTENDIKTAGKGDYEKGLFIISVDLIKTSKKVHELGGVIIVHNGRKDHGFDSEIYHAKGNANEHELLNTLGSEKEKLMKECVDICEFPNWNEYHQKERKFYLEIFNKASIVGSDSHEEYSGKKYTWIKADPTFNGLKQVLNEPKDRVYAGDVPPILSRVKKNKTKYIDYVKINKTKQSKIDEIWFEDIMIPLNSELIAIIGNKGNGKSALADIISLTGNTKLYNNFSFLNEDKFNKAPEYKAKNFEAQIVWYSNLGDKAILSDKPNEILQEKVKYIPQNYMEKLCNIEEEQHFERELKDVIFSHLSSEDRLQCENIDDLIDYKTDALNDRIRDIQNTITDINETIINLEKKRTDDNIDKIKSYLLKLENELDSHVKNKPDKISKPEEDEKTKEQLSKVNMELDKSKKMLEKIEHDIETKENEKKQIKLKLSKIKNTNDKIYNFEEQYKQFKDKISNNLNMLNLKVDDLISLNINTIRLDNFENEFIKRLEIIKFDLEGEETQNNKKSNTGLYAKQKEIKTTIKKLLDKLSEPQKNYEKYKQSLREWKNKENKIKNEISQTISKLKYIQNDLIQDLEQEKKQRLIELKKLFKAKKEILEIYKTIYGPIRNFIKDHNVKKPEYKVSFDASLDLRKNYFENNFFSLINQNAKGSFRGIEEGAQKLKKIISNTNFNNKKSIIKFIDEIDYNLQWDNRKENPNKSDIFSQVKEPEKLYDFLFHLNYLEPSYKLKLGNKNLSELSPGERGALLLIFYLLIDNDTIPLIIDQPEENLDNQSVFELLVPYIKEAKNNRQVIIVTHNPNLAVVCDAEQIIHAQIDKKQNKNKVIYYSGSIENLEINKCIVDILEGTMPAFSNRKRKYSLK